MGNKINQRKPAGQIEVELNCYCDSFIPLSNERRLGDAFCVIFHLIFMVLPGEAQGIYIIIYSHVSLRARFGCFVTFNGVQHGTSGRNFSANYKFRRQNRS
jgi:hypothetical protein